jgi:hypothetical protein
MKHRFPLELPIRPYLRDHCVEGKAVFPAVESLAVLAGEIQKHFPGALLKFQADANFPKMLVMTPDADTQSVQIEIEERADGIQASLQTTVIAKNSPIRRTLEHSRVTFVRKDALPEAAVPFSAAWKLRGAPLSVSADSIYRELVPFGLSYRNIAGSLSVSGDGALAEIFGGSGEADDTLLGSPFVLDAMMHAACVWGQRFAGIVAFPIGFDRRVIHQATKKGETYFARVTPADGDSRVLRFDAWIFDRQERLCESVRGLRMCDIFRGRLQPPPWIREGI